MLRTGTSKDTTPTNARAAIVRWYVRNAGESPCGDLPFSRSLFIFLYSSQAAVSLSPAISLPWPLPLFLSASFPRKTGKLIHLYELLRRIVPKWYSWLLVLSRIDAGAYIRRVTLCVEPDSITTAESRENIRVYGMTMINISHESNHRSESFYFFSARGTIGEDKLDWKRGPFSSLLNRYKLGLVQYLLVLSGYVHYLDEFSENGINHNATLRPLDILELFLCFLAARSDMVGNNRRYSILLESGLRGADS